jgi:hypothetical protein
MQILSVFKAVLISFAPFSVFLRNLLQKPKLKQLKTVRIQISIS